VPSTVPFWRRAYSNGLLILVFIRSYTFSKVLTVRHIDGTTLLCLKVETPELHQKMQDVAARILKGAN
jgi:hypothetical protein